MGPLDGIRVVDAGLIVQGPQAAALLCEWGADVVKVELPGLGDQARWIYLAADDPRSAYFIACNRGKRSLTTDLRIREGREIFLRLAEWADVVISNFTPGTMESWGLGYDELAARNPRLVYATASTFGSLGPDAEREGADLSGQSAGGLISATGKVGGEPTPVGAAIADHVASQHLAAGVLAALFSRERTGRGQRVETSLLGSQIWAQASEITAYLLTGRIAGPANRGNPLIPGLYGIFPTSDGWIAIVGVVGPARTAFFNVIERPELVEQFPQPFYWAQDKAELFPLLDEAFSERTTQEWCSLLGAAGLRFAPVRDYAAICADPGVHANAYMREIDAPEGRDTVVCAPIRFSDTPAQPPAFAPELGQHTEEVLLEIGYSWDDIGALRDAGAI